MLASWEPPGSQKAGCGQGWRGAVVDAEARLWGHVVYAFGFTPMAQGALGSL